jgi:hypothetical protein
MPDGGSDCCGNCVFNLHWGSYHDPQREEQRERSAECVLRGIRTESPFWTYCEWFHGESLARLRVQFRHDMEEIFDNRLSPYQLDPARVRALVDKVLAYLSEHRIGFGPVLATGLGGSGYYGRIPWDGPTAPQTAAARAICFECAASTEYVVRISPQDMKETLEFCSDECYLAWWKTRHPDPPDWNGRPPIVAGRL